MNANASNRLYYGDVSSFEEAMRLHIEALRYESITIEPICEDGDDFPKRLMAEADAAEVLFNEYTERIQAVVKREKKAIFAEWIERGGDKARHFAEVAESGDFSSLAI